MAGFDEAKARVTWALLQRFREQKGVSMADVPAVSQTVTGELQRMRQERQPEASPLLVVDGLNLALRCFAANPTCDASGEHIGMVIGFLGSLAMLVRKFAPHDVLVCWDGEGGSRRRRGIFAEYKAGRKPRMNRHMKDDSPENSQQNLRMQYATVRRYVDLLGLRQVEVRDVEADDAIALVAKHLVPLEPKVIVSTDRDFLQLLDPLCSVYSPVKDVLYTPEELVKREGVLAANHVYVKALCGDGSDNVPGLKGLGPKTALKLYPDLGTEEVDLDGLLARSTAYLSLAKRNPSLERWHRRVLEAREDLFRNVKVMQLSTPIIGAHSVGVIREQASEEARHGPSLTELHLALARDGTAPRDALFFKTFEDLHIKRRAQRA